MDAKGTDHQTKTLLFLVVLQGFTGLKEQSQSQNPSSNVCLLSGHLGNAPSQLFSVIQGQATIYLKWERTMHHKLIDKLAFGSNIKAFLKACHTISKNY